MVSAQECDEMYISMMSHRVVYNMEVYFWIKLKSKEKQIFLES